MRGLMCSLIKYQTIETTLARAKETRREAEKIITLAKRGGLANRRLIIARLNDIETAGLLMDIIAPQIKRDSGYLKIEHSGYRRGDNAEMGTISFVDEINMEVKPKETPETAKKSAKTEKKSQSSKKEGK